MPKKSPQEVFAARVAKITKKFTSEIAKILNVAMREELARIGVKRAKPRKRKPKQTAKLIMLGPDLNTPKNGHSSDLPPL